MSPRAELEAPPELEVHLPSLLRPAVGGASSVRVRAATLGQCFERLVAQHPLLAPHLFNDRGDLREHVNVFVNERNVRWLESRETPLYPGDSITILQAVSGG